MRTEMMIHLTKVTTCEGGTSSITPSHAQRGPVTFKSTTAQESADRFQAAIRNRLAKAGYSPLCERCGGTCSPEQCRAAKARRGRPRIRPATPKESCRCGGRHYLSLCQNMKRPSRSRQASCWALGTGATLDAAAKRFKITRQAVCIARRDLGYPERLPGPARVDLSVMLAMAAAGVFARDIARDLDCSVTSVYKLCKENGVPLRRVPQPGIDVIDLAVAAVRAGATLVDAAADHGIRRSRLARITRQRGISVPVQGYMSRVNGSSRRALQRVLDGASLADACEAERCAQDYVRRLVVKAKAGQLRPPRAKRRLLDGADVDERDLLDDRTRRGLDVQLDTLDSPAAGLAHEDQ